MADLKYIRQQRILYWIIGLGLLILLSANTLAWIYLQRIKIFFISDLKFRLENIVRISSNLIDASDLAYILPGDVSNPQVIFYQQLLYEIQENNNLQDILILTPTSEILVDINPHLRRGQALRHLETDLVEIALGGRVATGNLQTLGSHKFLTAVSPLLDSDNVVTGLLVVEARAEFFQALDQFNRGLIAFSIINITIIISVAILFIRSFKKIFNLQNQIKNQEHLVKLGEMAASVAHELRNPLGIIKAANSLIEKKYGAKGDEFFEYIPTELTRLNKMIEDFLSFARSRALHIQKIDVSQLLDKVKLAIFENKNIKLNIKISEKLTTLETDADCLEQIILNVLKNAMQAVKNEGKIEIVCDVISNKARIAISDNGQGISPEIQNRIFEPFFSTRDEGSGLGLAISKRLIEQLKGEIQVRSQPDSGTRVLLLIPLKYS
jgi:signal transduction histidine kinase